MSKVLAVAFNEYRQVVLTKSFIISLLFPVFIYGGIVVMTIFLRDKTDLRDREFAVVDATERLYPAIEQAAARRNRGEDVFVNGRQIAPEFKPVEVEPGEERDALLKNLTQQVRAKELFGFVLIGEDYLSVDGGNDDRLEYYSDSPTYLALPGWIEDTVRQRVEEIRFDEAPMELRTVRQLLSHNDLERFALPEIDESGELRQPRKENEAAAFLIPFGLSMLMFFSVQLSMPVLLNTVVEEKMQRIAEVLLSTVSSFQLLAGKLLAGVGVGLTFSIVYLFSLGFSLSVFEEIGFVEPRVYPWFIAFLLTALLTFGSMFAAVSSASQDLKDSQNFAGAVVMILFVPLVLAMALIGSPDSTFARVVSLIPPLSPMTMMVRVAISPGPPAWEIWLALALNLVFSVFMVYVASRIFRIGMLLQGRTPKWRELLRWAVRD